MERGRYLAVLGDCAGCHTRAHGAPFAGGLPFHAQFGTVYSTNITPDVKTGIGGWTQGQFYRALHDGIAADGSHLYPAFPYAYFRRLTRQDTADLYAYLRTLKPVHQPPTSNRLTFPFNIRALMTFWNWLYLPHDAPKPEMMKSAAWRRGEYLVNGLGHCGACHTPKNILFGDVTGKELTGAVVDHWFSANLTGSRAEGLGNWNEADLVIYLQTGRNRYATAAGSMQEKVTSSTSHMRQEDRTAIATYLKSLAPHRLNTRVAPDATRMAAGQAVFIQHCVVCHQPPQRIAGPSIPLPDYPRLGGDTLVAGRDPTTVLRIILQGAQSPLTPNAPIAYSMPSFATLSDQQVADVATYIRARWGNGASSIGRSAVHKLRAALKGEARNN
ncbi:MAG: cytochrome c [Alphaproteobacteria bacterium]|nr:cytochrome c [Alphaproteobacteria bacterium]